MLQSYSTKVIAFFSGIIITLLSGVGFAIKSWLENKSVLKECLFSLLKIHKALNYISFIDSGKMRETILEKLQEEYSHDFEEEDIEEAREYFDKFINAAFDPARSKFEEDLSENYSSTIKKLASIKPILAYDISNRLYLKNYLNSLDDVISTDTEYLDKESVEYLQKVSQNPTVEESRETLQKYILKIAFRASKLSWIKLKFFSVTLSDDPFNVEEKIENYLKRARKHKLGE